MMQTIEGKTGYVVDLPDPATLARPITGRLTHPTEVAYARALEAALTEGIITEAGKYLIVLTSLTTYEIHAISEPKEG